MGRAQNRRPRRAAEPERRAAEPEPDPRPGDELAVELEVLPGLLDDAAAEIEARLRRHLTGLRVEPPDAVHILFTGPLERLTRLRTVVAAHVVITVAVPRPKALLGDAHLRRLVAAVERVVGAASADAFTGLRLRAAGEHSPVMRRLCDELANATDVPVDPEGDLVVRVRPSRWEPDAWDVLIRTTPRPLSARAWRVRNYEGAVNATIGAAMVERSRPRPDDRVLNLMCGSGTLLIERLRRGPAAAAVGLDLSATALAAASENRAGAGLSVAQAVLLRGDATALPFAGRCFDVVLADPPWGMLTGEHDENETLYRDALTEAARVSTPGARLVLLSQEVHRVDQLLPDLDRLWEWHATTRVFQKGHHPRIYELTRRR